MFGLAVLVSGPAAAEVDCLPDAVKAPVARPAGPHKAAAHRPVRKASAPRPRAKAVAGDTVRKASAPHRTGKPKVRKVAHHGPAKGATLRKIATSPAVAVIGDTRPASAVAAAGVQRAPLLHKVACPTHPVGPPMSVVPADIVEAANQMPFAETASLVPSEAPAVAGTDAVATEPDDGFGLFPFFPPATRSDVATNFLPGASGGGGGGGGGGQPPTVPDGGTTTPTTPDNPTGPTGPTPPTDGQPPFVNPFEPGTPGTPGVPGTPGEPGTPGGWMPPGDVTPPGGGGAVPEPATWAMMILGFGLVGSSLRRMRRLATTR